MDTNEPLLQLLDVARTRLANAKAEKIELRNARSKREVMGLAEVDGLLARLYSRFIEIDLGSRVASERVVQQLEIEMGLIHETIDNWKAQS